MQQTQSLNRVVLSLDVCLTYRSKQTVQVRNVTVALLERCRFLDCWCGWCDCLLQSKKGLYSHATIAEYGM